ncbi:MAG: type III-B CRISPR module RAMP protein Cmr4 [Deltaproteobacteria bacterium]|nr:type III-B CRISPR module RAMP protein Cmr4 [Deltaproteobacteria bacterium]
MTDVEKKKSFKTFGFAGLALDPIHVGTGGTRLGRVDNTIVRDPVTRIPKIPGSSLAGVMRAYTAMKHETINPGCRINGKNKPYFPDCAGQGGGASGHCGRADCPVCAVFGFAKGKDDGGGFAGLAAFSDMHVLLFPVASQLGPQWITCPMALRQTGIAEFSELADLPEQNMAYRKEGNSLNLGWLFLGVKTDWQPLDGIIQKIKEWHVPDYIISRMGVVSDKLFAHIVNSNLEVRTSVAIDPATGAAEDKALFTYEAMPRGTVLEWQVTCRNPNHFMINKYPLTAVESSEGVKNFIVGAHCYLEHLGIGGMGSRGMGRLRVLKPKEPSADDKPGKEVS